MKLAFYDLETTGTDKEKNGVHQIAMILVTPTDASEINFSVRPREGCVGSQEALDICGKTVEELRAYPEMRQVHADILHRLNRYCDKFNPKDKFTLIGYNNRGFDDDFFRRWFADCGDNYYGSWFWPNTIDVMVLATQHLLDRRPDMPNFKLHTVARELGIDVDDTKLHDALYDVNLTKQMYEILTK
jgi:DNA polymerase-3 subunit epsilon